MSNSKSTGSPPSAGSKRSAASPLQTSTAVSRADLISTYKESTLLDIGPLHQVTTPWRITFNKDDLFKLLRVVTDDFSDSITFRIIHSDAFHGIMMNCMSMDRSVLVSGRVAAMCSSLPVGAFDTVAFTSMTLKAVKDSLKDCMSVTWEGVPESEQVKWCLTLDQGSVSTLDITQCELTGDEIPPLQHGEVLTGYTRISKERLASLLLQAKNVTTSSNKIGSSAPTAADAKKETLTTSLEFKMRPLQIPIDIRQKNGKIYKSESIAFVVVVHGDLITFNYAEIMMRRRLDVTVSPHYESDEVESTIGPDPIVFFEPCKCYEKGGVWASNYFMPYNKDDSNIAMGPTQDSVDIKTESLPSDLVDVSINCARLKSFTDALSSGESAMVGFSQRYMLLGIEMSTQRPCIKT